MLLIKNAVVVAMDPSKCVLLNGAVAVEKGRIVSVGGTEALIRQFDYDQVLDAGGKLLLPGFVNAHTHMFQTPLRGFGDDLPLAQWLGRGVYPFAYYMDGEACYHASRLSMAEMIRSGVTTYVDSHYITRDKYCYDSIIHATEEIGMRGVISRASVDQAPAPKEFREPVAVAAKECARIIQRYHGSGDGLIQIRVEPMNEVAASAELTRTMYEISRQYGVGMCMHIVETKERLASSLEKYGKSPVAMLDAAGMLGSHLLLAHCIWTTPEDRQRLAESGTCIVHNPVANQYLGDGIAPIVDYGQRGIPVALGTDGAAGNNNLDMFAVMKAACLLQKVAALDSSVITASQALEMATIGGARALGLQNEIGSIEPGKYADMILIDLDTVQMVPRCNYLSNLVYAASPAVVDTVMIQGNIVFQNKAFVHLNEGVVIDEANKLVERLRKKVRSTM